MTRISVTCHSPDETQTLGKLLGQHLHGGEVLALDGPLGTGKTQLTKGIAEGLEVPPDSPIVSPTFVLVREYPGRIELLHCDAYRLAGPEEFLDLGLLEEAEERRAVLVIEWAERVRAALPEEIWQIEGAHVDAETRRFSMQIPASVGEAIAAGGISHKLDPAG